MKVLLSFDGEGGEKESGIDFTTCGCISEVHTTFENCGHLFLPRL